MEGRVRKRVRNRGKSYGGVGEDYEEELMGTGRGGNVVDFRSAPTAACYDPELRSPRVCA